MKRRVLGAICLISVCSAALAATVSRAPGAVDSFGVGLKLGRVVNTIPVGSSFGPWLVWDKSTCSYQDDVRRTRRRTSRPSARSWAARRRSAT